MDSLPRLRPLVTTLWTEVEMRLVNNYAANVTAKSYPISHTCDIRIVISGVALHM